jgi:hypothetical protein
LNIMRMPAYTHSCVYDNQDACKEQGLTPLCHV